MGHSTWDSYSQLTKVHKHMELALTTPGLASRSFSMSSYPGGYPLLAVLHSSCAAWEGWGRGRSLPAVSAASCTCAPAAENNVLQLVGGPCEVPQGQAWHSSTSPLAEADSAL